MGNIQLSDKNNSNKKYQWTFVFVGNPSRGDDGIGPALFQKMDIWLDQQRAAQTSVLTNDIQLIDCFQLEPELCCDIENSTTLIVIDACTIDAANPWIETLSVSSQDTSVWTHAMSPSSLLALFKKVYKKPPPTAYLLHVPGKQFDLGAALSQSTEKHLPNCISILQQCCLATSPQGLQKICLNNTADASHNNDKGFENA